MKLIQCLRLGMALACSYPLLSSALEIKLTDSIERITTGFPIVPSFSEHGERVYCVYEINVDNNAQPPINLAAEIFSNHNGELHSVASLLGDENFPSIDDGRANTEFSRFCLVDDNMDTQIRIRIFDEQFNELAVRVFNDYAAGNPNNPAFSGAGGVFSEDGKYVALTYLTDATPNHEKSVIHILHADDLSTVARKHFQGGSYGPEFITLHRDHEKKTYVTFSSYEGQFIFSFDNALAKAPSTLFVFEIKHDSLKLIDTAKLPQASQTPSVCAQHKSALIGVGTGRAVLHHEKTIFALNEANESFLKKNGNELRIYDFDGHKLELAYSKNKTVTTSAPAFTSGGDYLLVNEQAVDGSPGFFNIYRVKEHHKDEIELGFHEGTFVSPPFHHSTFSKNRKWLLVTGSDQAPNLNDINLYKVED